MVTVIHILQLCYSAYRYLEPEQVSGKTWILPG